MKKIALALAVIALIVGGLTLWGYLNARLEISVESVQPLPAQTFQAEYDRLVPLIRGNAARGLVYDPVLSGNAGDYVILQYTLLVRNRGLVQADMLEAQIVPVKGDVFCYSQQEAMGQDVNLSFEIAPGQTARCRVYLLTRKDLHAVRDLQVSYYIWGNPFIITVKYG